MEPTAIALIALAILVFATISRRAERSSLTAPMFFLAIGVAASPLGLGLVGRDEGHEPIHILAELTLILVLFTDASRIDFQCLKRQWGLPLRLLGVGMPLTIGLGAVVAMWVVPGLGGIEALLLASILAPTDAALGQAVVSNDSVPIRIRQSLNVESGLNDGIALPVVLVLASLAGAHESGGEDTNWIQFTVLAVTLGPLVGAAVGFIGGKIAERGTQAGWINDPFQRILGPGLALLAFGGAEAVGGNGFIAAFVAGLALGNTSRAVCTCLHEFGEAEGQLLTLLVFFVFGATLVPEAMEIATGAAVLYGALSLTAIRMLPVALALIGSGLRPASIMFLGWFGPRGLASILFGLLVIEGEGLGSGPLILSVVVITVLLSTVAHGLTAYPLAKKYGELADQMDASSTEHEQVQDLRVRIRHSETDDG